MLWGRGGRWRHGVAGFFFFFPHRSSALTEPPHDPCSPKGKDLPSLPGKCAPGGGVQGRGRRWPAYRPEHLIIYMYSTDTPEGLCICSSLSNDLHFSAPCWVPPRGEALRARRMATGYLFLWCRGEAEKRRSMYVAAVAIPPATCPIWEADGGVRFHSVSASPGSARAP